MSNVNPSDITKLTTVGPDIPADAGSDLLTPDWKITARLTTDDALDVGPIRELTADQAESYLNSGQRNALVLMSARDDTTGILPVFEPNIYVVRGASGKLDNFYYGDMPAEDPNDAEGGDLTAIQAIAYATGAYYE